MKLKPTGETLGARVENLDISVPLSEQDRSEVMSALGHYGVLEFPQQTLSPQALRDFSAQFGELFISPGGRAQEPGFPEIMNLSNIVRDGHPVGLSDAGQSWHTDMSYMRMIAFSNVLYGLIIPSRDGHPLGATQFRNMHAVCDALPPEIRARLNGRRGIHDFEKFWDMMRREKGSSRPALSEAERRARPPVSQPLIFPHPITGREVLYANPGYLTGIEGVPRKEAEELMNWLFEFQDRDEFLFEFHWSPRSVLMWDNIGTTHNAVADYGPDEPRHIKRCQVMATEFYGGTGTGIPVQALA
ncbi:TauD/TfdA dioxygenase family protein [Ottowia thiooxydans]|uniref:TauD/TfdA dioxygenase family protein n=1 Tax=Ottowia thiooxydans TaxID=219182 RepID=UPI00041AB789|nr:TauD/TfdA family dioxygenase [Ottowia thiooxydans]